jgi:NitT/TauT family transport system substrate-binding protein
MSKKSQGFWPKVVSLVFVVSLLVACAPTVAPAPAPVGESEQSAAVSPTKAPELVKAKYVLPWVVQGESAGYLAAKELGYYEAEGIDLEIIPGGPDIRTNVLVANGDVEFGTGGPPFVVNSIAQGMPIVMVMQQNQIDGLRLICKDKTGIKTWNDLEGKKVGVWFGGGEYPLYYAAKKVGLDRDKVQWLPQKFSMVEFFEDKFDCASVQVWNELHVAIDAGYPRDTLTILNPFDVGAYLTADGVFTSKKILAENPELVQGFVNASLRGFTYCLANPNECAEITLKFAPDLDLRKQLLQVEEVNLLVISGAAEEKGMIGWGRQSDWESALEMLMYTEQLKEEIDVSTAYTNEFWEKAPDEYKNIENREELLKRIEENIN